MKIFDDLSTDDISNYCKVTIFYLFLSILMCCAMSYFVATYLLDWKVKY